MSDSLPRSTPTLLRVLAPDAEFRRQDQGLKIVRGRIELEIPSPGAGLEKGLEALAADGASQKQLEQWIRIHGKPQDLLRLALLLEDLDHRRLLSWQVTTDGSADDPGTVLLTLVPYRNAVHPPQQEGVPSTSAWQLSRFAYLRRKGNEVVVESPLAGSYILPRGDHGLALLSGWFHKALDESELSAGFEGLSLESARGIIDLLWQHGFLCSVDADGQRSDEHDPKLQQWQFHDLMFHARSRHGRHDEPYGGTYPFAGKAEPLPAVPGPRGEPAFDLYQPDLDQLMAENPGFTRVLEQRRSWRTPQSQPLTARQLGELLFRTCRAKRPTEPPRSYSSDTLRVGRPSGPASGAVAPYSGPSAVPHQIDSECDRSSANRAEMLQRSHPLEESRVGRPSGLVSGIDHETSRRVYPGGGALYELEIYPLVHRCQGLDPGLYHYDAVNHRLEAVAGDQEVLTVLLETAAQSAGNVPLPDVLLLVSARFQRVTWKYRSMAYAGILKNVGVLYQTLYLAASAMNLGICALGGGNSDLFARATGLEYTVETSVGELLLNGSLDTV